MARDPFGNANITAFLGPTNTGKTHRAIDRMLAHRTGMIGLPLRLLAREVYDRISALKGEHSVALITGEEKRIPPDPRWYVCTVEAMPTDRPVNFLAVDEIQLAGDRARGHKFTERLLHARGVDETLFLGSETIAPLLSRLVPQAQIESFERFSKLTGTPPKKLTSLPKRTAVVAFSADGVYSLAERLRGQFGGTAVVLGALSPRARNAQIAMYQSGEVNHIVATDAIGMGLNMDIDHVAFAAVRKFDGRGARALSASEVAQIAGRAGRYTRDGTFGPTTDLGPLDPELVAAVEAHQFPPLTALFWRNAELDLSSIEGLQDSLERNPPHPSLIRVRDGEDHRSLEALIRRPEVLAFTKTSEGVRRLWDVCAIPDFRKTMTDSHVELLATLFDQLSRHGQLDEDFVAERVGHCDRTEGDIEILMARMAGIRTWTFIATRSNWVKNAAHWQGVARNIEDRLSDALHERLTARFVDARTMVAFGETPVATVDAADGTVHLGGVKVGKLVGLRFQAENAMPEKAARKAIDRAVDALIAQRVQLCVEAEHSAFAVDPEGLVTWGGAPVARLSPGPSILEPKVSLLRLDKLGGGARDRVAQRLTAWSRDMVAPLIAFADNPAIAKLDQRAGGVMYQLVQALGTLPYAAVADDLAALTDADRLAFTTLGVRFGREAIFAAPLLKLQAIRARAFAWAVAHEVHPFPTAPAAVPSAPPAGSDALAWATGYRRLGTRWVRVDVAEKLAAAIREVGRQGDFMMDPLWPSWLNASNDDTISVIEGLGFGKPNAEGVFAGARPKRKPPKVHFRG